MGANKGKRLVVLDGLRGIAAVVVMLYHLGNFYGFGGPFERGYLFVDFFFLLSGFVLAGSVESRFAHGWTTAAFMKARIVRLWPVIALGIAAGSISFGVRNGWSDVPFYAALALALVPLLRPWATPEIYPLNPPQWSLLFELLANLLHGLLLRRLQNRMLLAFAAICALMILRFSFLKGNISVGPDAADWFLGLPRAGFAYTMGVWIGRQHAKAVRPPLTTWPVALLLPLFAAVAASVLRYDIWLVDSLVAIIVFPVSLWIAASTQVGASVGRWLQRLGGISFPLYAVHLPVVSMFAAFDRSVASAAAAAISSLLGAFLLGITLEGRGGRAQLSGASRETSAVAA